MAIDMSCTGKFIMSCSAKTDVVLYDLNGTILSKLDTVLGKNFWAKISPDGKLLASSGFTPDVKASNSANCLLYLLLKPHFYQNKTKNSLI